MNVFIVSVWIIEVPFEFIPAKEPGQITQSCLIEQMSHNQSDTHLHHQAFSEFVQTANSSSNQRLSLPFTYSAQCYFSIVERWRAKIWLKVQRTTYCRFVTSKGAPCSQELSPECQAPNVAQLKFCRSCLFDKKCSP